MYIDYKLFPTDRERTLTEYITFYQTRFPALFKWFYPSMREDGFVPFADRFKNDDRCFNGGTDDWSPNFLSLTVNPDGTFGHIDHRRPKDELGVYSMDPTALYFFSASVFFTALVPQVIWKVAGEDAWQAFCKAAAWPRMSAGLAGYVSAEQWIYESDEELLFPVPEEAPYYNALQIRYAYCVTCHKAQGGQWRHVYIDSGLTDEWMKGLEEPEKREYLRWLYTALTRSTEKVYLLR